LKIKCLTSSRPWLEQLFVESDKHSVNVNKSIILSAAVDDHETPKLATVFNKVMYVPPKRGSLIREKNDNADTYMMYITPCNKYKRLTLSILRPISNNNCHRPLRIFVLFLKLHENSIRRQNSMIAIKQLFFLFITFN